MSKELMIDCSIKLLLFCIVTFDVTSGYYGPKMGLVNNCDDAKTNLTVDWDEDFLAFTCTEQQWISQPNIPSEHYSIPDLNPLTDKVRHFCMDSEIYYNESIPLRGPHRPNWAIFGEYLYLPPQRWLHNLEHGSVVMLYHPCADLEEVAKLRSLLVSCIRRHVITPYRNVSEERPLVLVSWGSKLEMNKVNTKEVVKFIRNHARRAPEDYSKLGIYKEWLINPARVVSDVEDSQLCPQYPVWVKHKKSRRIRSVGKRADGVRTYYDQVYLKQLQQHNGPKFANDVLPPSAMNKQFEQPSYVMAGTYLGQDPYNPDTGHKTVTEAPVLSNEEVSKQALLQAIVRIINQRNSMTSPSPRPSQILSSEESTRISLIKTLLIRLICRNRPELLSGCQQKLLEL